MATFAWPDSLAPSMVSWIIQKSGVQFRSPFAGSVEAIEFPGQFWRVSVTLAPSKTRNSGEAEAFLARIAGGAERVLVPYWPRLQPRGTLRGSPALTVAAVRGDLSLSIGAAAGVTLRAGDMIGCGTQLFQCFQDCASDGTTLTVPLVNRVRGALAIGAAVVWSRPTVTCCLPSPSSSRSYEPGAAGSLAADLEEV